MDFVALLRHFYATELGRIAATAIAMAIGFALPRLWVRYLLVKGAGRSAAHNREKLVYARNIFWVVVFITIAGIWASKIAGIVLSLAAVAGAILLVSKELLMCALGYGYLAFSRAFRVGDFVELGPHHGRVIDVDIFSTTLAETGSAHQLTGKTITVPNSLMLSQPVRNSSATGEYIVNLMPILVPFDTDLDLAERCALEAAQQVTSDWQIAAQAHLEHIEGVAFVDLPSSRPKVLWQPYDAKAHSMVIRFGCPMMQRVTAEQDIFRRFWQLYNQACRLEKSLQP